MMKFGREFSRAYGVDLDDARLQVVVAERGRAGPSVRTVLDQAPGPGGLDEPGCLSSVQADLLAGTATLCAALPTGSGFLRWLETPFDSRRKAERVLPALLDIQLPFPLDRCVYRFPRVEAAPRSGRFRALAVAARTGDLEDRIGRLSGLGLDPISVEHEALALWRQHRREQRHAEPGAWVLAYVGASRSALVLGQGDHLQAAFPLAAGADALRHGSGDREGGFGGAHASFLQRARHVLQAHVLGDTGPVQWTWAGPGAEEAAVRAKLEEGLRDRGNTTFSVAHDPASYLARALANDALDGSALPGDLRTGPLEHPMQAQRRHTRLLRVAALGAAAGVLLCALALAGPWLLDRVDARFQAEITRQAKVLTGMRAVPRGQELLVVEQKLAQRTRQADIVRRAAEPVASGIVDRAVRQAAAGAVTLTGVTARPGFFSIKGTAADRERAGAFGDALQVEGFGTTLETEPEPGGGVQFVLKGEARSDE